MFVIIIIGVIFLLLRIINLNIIPVFADEAIYIHWAQLAWHDSTLRFISLTDGKPPLHTWLMIPFLKIIKDPLLAGRLLSITAGLAVLIAIYLIVKKVFNHQSAIIASILISIAPFLVFYDRLAVADSLLTAFGAWSFYLSLLLIEKPDLGKAFLLGFCWGGGLLTKPPALYFIVLMPLIFLLKKNISFNDLKKQVFYSVIALLISLLLYNVIKLSSYSHLIAIRSYDYILGKREFLNHPFQLFWGNMKAIIPWIYSYQTVIPTIFLILGIILLWLKDWKKALIFSSWLVIPILGSAAIGKIIFPRYFIFIQPWIIVFISYGLNCLVVKVRPLHKAGPFLASCMYFLAILPWLYFSLLIIFKPTKAPLLKREQDQYLTTWSSGYGIKEIALYLKQKHPLEKVYVATEGYFGTLPDGLQIYLDGRQNFEVYGVGQPLDKVPEGTLKLAKTTPTYFVINSTRYYGTQDKLELIQSFPKPEFPFLKESLLFFRIKSE